jgi:hypothetical protein
MVYTIHLWRMVYYWFTSINMYPHRALLYFVFVFLHELFVDFTHVPVYPVSELALAKQQYDKGPKFLTSKISPKGCAYCDTKIHRFGGSSGHWCRTWRRLSARSLRNYARCNGTWMRRGTSAWHAPIRHRLAHMGSPNWNQGFLPGVYGEGDGINLSLEILI